MAIKNLTAPKTFVAGGAITENQLVKFHSVSMQVVAAGAGDRAIGVAQHAAASGEEVSVEMTIGAIVKVVASAAITLNDRLEPAAAGAVATVAGAAQSVGFALEAATAENDVISMLLAPENVTIEDILAGLTATVAELNLLAGAGAVVASGTQAAVIADPAGGATTDAEARTAINSIIDALQAFGIVATS